MPGLSVEAVREEISATLKKVGDKLRTQAEHTNKELEKYGRMGEETRASVDKLLMEQGALQARLNAAEQAIVAQDKGHQEDGQMTLGARLVSAEAFTQVNSSWRGIHRVSAPRSEITTATAGELVQPDHRGLILPAQRRMTVRDLIMPGETSSNAIEYVQETGFTNNAGVVAEGAQKPYSDIAFDLVTTNVRTIAHLFKVSRQMLDDAPALQSYIDGRASYGLQLAEEKQLLFGDGTGQNLKGIVPSAQTFNAEFEPEMQTVIDRVRLALLQVALAEYAADGLVLNPVDWAMIETTKDKEGRYIVGNAINGATPTLWNMPVVETQAMTKSNFLAGAFGMGAQIFDRMEIEVLISTENDKDFEKNMATIRAEERLAFAVYRPEAFVTGSTVITP
ncbi:capsid protein [Thiopseudomonas alkaliphila]|uniref:Capsid protein n=1 Tax=Thiopseudomonas alkaliphila TaxID=1697053 RepID=A0A0K1XGT9_9GAMM|nr:phage major capsid protein [Thiopseudomonas alkaliphila]AKX52030.1 capsid protein [Thiopseudomonas alkaliphila]AKX60469.1 capsid protein [Thiopseudomonas alkaliphila]